MAKKVPSARVFEEWTERDLTAAARNGELPPAFEIDDQIALASDVLSARTASVRATRAPARRCFG